MSENILLRALESIKNQFKQQFLHSSNILKGIESFGSEKNQILNSNKIQIQLTYFDKILIKALKLKVRKIQILAKEFEKKQHKHKTSIRI